MALRNVRFTVFHKGSPVVITLKPGQRIDIQEYCRTDEGYDSSRERYAYSECGQFLYCEFDSAASDCDGPLYRSSESVCEPWADDSRNEYGGFNNWERVSYSQHDVFAEQMGY